MTFNEKLIKLRKLRGITQDEFASAVGVSRQAVYKWESGQSYPEVSKLIEIKNLFNISIDDLLDDNYEVILPPKKKRLSQKKRREIENIVNIEEGIIEPELEIETVEEKAIEEEAVAVASAPIEEALPSVEETAAVEEAPEVKEEVVTPAPEESVPVETVEEAPAPVNTKESEPTEEKKDSDNAKRGFFKRFFGK